MKKPTVVIIKFSSWRLADESQNHPEYTAIFNLLKVYGSKINFVLIGTSETHAYHITLKNGAIAYDIKNTGKLAQITANLNLLKILLEIKPNLVIILGMLNVLPVAIHSLFSSNSQFVPILIGEFGYRKRKLHQFLMSLGFKLLGMSLELAKNKILRSFTLSNYTRNYVTKYAPSLSGKISLISYPISPNFCSTKISVSEQSKDPTLLTVARVSPRKGQDTLLKAAVFLPKNVKIILKGGITDSDYMVRLRSLVKELGIEDRVSIITESVDYNKLVEYYQSATLFVFPTRDDCLGVVVLEALHCGLPVVASSVGGIPDMIEDGANGLLVNVDDPRDLANKIMLLLNDDNLRANLSKNSRSVLNKRYYSGRITLQAALIQSVEAQIS